MGQLILIGLKNLQKIFSKEASNRQVRFDAFPIKSIICAVTLYASHGKFG